ncbi:hypothetical protein D3C72_1388140 [compost metagenome]
MFIAELFVDSGLTDVAPKAFTPNFAFTIVITFLPLGQLALSAATAALSYKIKSVAFTSDFTRSDARGFNWLKRILLTLTITA